jgi:hypothetical protein
MIRLKKLRQKKNTQKHLKISNKKKTLRHLTIKIISKTNETITQTKIIINKTAILIQIIRIPTTTPIMAMVTKLKITDIVI